ncbi:hypothetical protein [Paludibaculum fermentans]|uniref:hypothetical protein n=1 Tax=Paludibaculum fermentans TaxID=1473598 RepID=UPI003EC03BB3
MHRILAAVLAITASAADFHYGFAGANSDGVQLRLAKSPQFFIAQKLVAVEVTAPAGVAQPGQVQPQAAAVYPASGTPGAPQPQILSALPTPNLDMIRSAAENGLAAAGFKIVSAQPGTIVRLTVSSYDPIRTQQTTLQQTVTVRDPATGQPVQQQIPVEFWEGSGLLALRIEVVEPGSNRVVDGFATSDSFSKRGQIGVNGRRTVDPGQLPIADGIWQQLVKNTTDPILARYGTTEEKVEFLLATEEELRPGNQFARNGNWKIALARWQEAAFNKKPAEASRAFNMAAAHEALAYEALRTQNAASGASLLNRAEELYQKAMELEPREKNFQAAGERLRKASAEFNRALAQQASIQAQGQRQQAELDAVAAQAELARRQAEAGVKAQQEKAQSFEAKRADTAPEASFRQLARVRLRAQNGPASEEDRAKLIALGQQVYKLDSLAAERVVHQEAKLWVELLPRIASYREMFAVLFGDRKITPAERAALNDLSKSLDLSADEVKEIEAQFTEGK